MSLKNLRSWQIASPQAFYPTNIQCIGSGAERAVSTYSPHTVNTFIFRNFNESIENDRPPHKSYLNASLYPDRIEDVAVGNSETVMLLDSGQLKYFVSPKKLGTVPYLANVKSICCCKNGFALIKTSDDATKFFVEIHPDAFSAKAEIHGRQTYDISFDQVLPLPSTFRQTQFKIKELQINAENNQFLKMIFSVEFMANNRNIDRFLFLAMDNSFCSLHVMGEEHVVTPIVMCGGKIMDFWAGTAGDHILLFLENGAMEILYLNVDSTGISKQNVYFGSEIEAYFMHDDWFVYSSGFDVSYGKIDFVEEKRKFKYNRNTIDLPGVAAMTYLREYHSVLCVSENRQFYIIAIDSKERATGEDEWFEVNEKTKRQLAQVKYELVELNEAYETLLEQQKRQQNVLDIIKLKQADLKATNNGASDDKCRFIATCSVTRSPPIQQRNDLFTNIVNLSNSLVYDRTRSFFVNINLTAVIYANQFDVANLWHLRCRWLNDKRENEYANVRLAAGMLSQPLTMLIHMQQQQIFPYFEMDISTTVRNGGEAATLIQFPIRVEQPDYCSMMDGCVLQQNNDSNETKTLICTVIVPKVISLDELFADKLTGVSKKAKKPLTVSNQKSYMFYLLGKTLKAIHYPDKQALQLKCDDAEFMNSFKLFVHRSIERKLGALNRKLDVTVSSDALKEYYVSSINYQSLIFEISIDRPVIKR